MGEADQDAGEHDRRGRTPSDVAMLLVELGRALRGQELYPRGDPRGEELLDRSWCAWQAELERHGPLDLELRRGAFWLAETDVTIGRGRLGELARALAERGLGRLSFDLGVDACSFRGLLELLALEREELAKQGGLQQAFSRQERQGIRLEEQHSSKPPAGPAPELGEVEGVPPPFASPPPSPGLFADLIDQACSADVEASLDAAQLLLRRGPEVVPELLDAWEAEVDPGHRRRLLELLIVLAEAALPALVHAIEEGGGRRALTALRLAGETQNSKLVPLLRRAALGRDAGLRRQASRALVQIGSASALAVLTEMLRSSVPGVPETGASCLAATGSPRAVPPLLESVHQALRSGRIESGLEGVRALGQLDCPQAVGALTGFLRRRGLRHRGRLRKLKLAAIAALARLPGREAREALTRTARARDARLRRAARLALEHSAQRHPA